MKWSRTRRRAPSFIPRAVWLLLVPAALIFLFFQCSSTTHRTFTIATAASSQHVMRELADSFALAYATKVNLVVGSSGSLTARILAGAPYDLLISADDRYPQRVIEAGKAFDKASVFAYNGLVLWTRDPALPLSLDSFDHDDPQRISLASPVSAPFGRLADSLLRLRPDYPALLPHLVYGESISSVSHYVGLGIGYGLTARSMLHAPRISPLDRWADFHPEVRLAQTAIIVSGGQVKEAQAFLHFLASATGRRILLRHGYRLPAQR